MLRNVSSGLVIAVAVALALSGCSPGDDGPVFRSGWLGPLVSLESVPGEGGEGVYVRRGEEANPPLDSIYLAEVEVTVAPGSNLAAIDAGDARAMREMLEARIRSALDDGYRLAPGQRPSSYTLRVALTNVMVRRAPNSDLRVGREDLRFGFDGAAIQSELSDGRTNARRAATFARLDHGDAEGDPWTALGSRFEAIARRLAGQIDVARQALAVPPPKPKQEE